MSNTESAVNDEYTYSGEPNSSTTSVSFESKQLTPSNSSNDLEHEANENKLKSNNSFYLRRRSIASSSSLSSGELYSKNINLAHCIVVPNHESFLKWKTAFDSPLDAKKLYTPLPCKSSFTYIALNDDETEYSDDEKVEVNNVGNIVNSVDVKIDRIQRNIDNNNQNSKVNGSHSNLLHQKLSPKIQPTMLPPILERENSNISEAEDDAIYDKDLQTLDHENDEFNIKV